MESDRGRVLAGRDGAPQGLGDRTYVVRASATTDTDVVDPERLRPPRVVGHLESRAEEGLERDRENVRAVGGFQRLEGWHRRLGLVGNGLHRDVPADAAADPLDDL